eukprot:5000159-Pleurochrysis_carterae.AAC.4
MIRTDAAVTWHRHTVSYELYSVTAHAIDCARDGVQEEGKEKQQISTFERAWSARKRRARSQFVSSIVPLNVLFRSASLVERFK